MPGSINDILPEKISPEAEEAVAELLKRKVKSAANIAVRLLHAMEDRFGPEAREVVREMARSQTRPPRPDPGDPEEDLETFVRNLDRGCAGSHRWVRLTDEPGHKAYRYTRCLWAEVFRELGEPELGFIICAGDEPALKAFNPKIGFKRTQVLMLGDNCCDHEFTAKPED